GSLRNAIQSAQPGTVIRFAVPDGSTIVLSGVLPYIHTDLTIEGPGADLLTISGNNAGRIVVNYAHVTISGLTLTKGFDANGYGGAVYNEGTLTLRDLAITDSVAQGGAGQAGSWFLGGLTAMSGGGGGGGGAAGGAIFNNGGNAHLLLDRVLLSGNIARGGAG